MVEKINLTKNLAELIASCKFGNLYLFFDNIASKVIGEGSRGACAWFGENGEKIILCDSGVKVTDCDGKVVFEQWKS